MGLVMAYKASEGFVALGGTEGHLQSKHQAAVGHRRRLHTCSVINRRIIIIIIIIITISIVIRIIIII